MSAPLQKSSTDEHEKNLMTGSLEQRKEAFKEDEELMRETTKFVSEVIETAATEATKRKLQAENYSPGRHIGIDSPDPNPLLKAPLRKAHIPRLRNVYSKQTKPMYKR